MRTDERDRRLADLLDRVVAPIDPEPEARLRQIRHRGTRRRAVEMIAVVAAVTVFVGAVAVAATSIRDHQDTSERGHQSWTQLGGPGAGWSIRYPASWHADRLDEQQCSPAHLRLGALISSVPFRWHHPDGATEGQCFGSRWVFAGFPRDGIAIQIEPVGGRIGIEQPQPDTRFPIRKTDLQVTNDIRGGPAYSYLTIWHGGEELVDVGMYVGAGASRADQASAERTLESLRLRLPRR